MKLTPEMETKGLKAYEQVRAFEALQRRGLPWIYAGFTGIMVVLGAVSQSNQRGLVCRLVRPELEDTKSALCRKSKAGGGNGGDLWRSASLGAGGESFRGTGEIEERPGGGEDWRGSKGCNGEQAQGRGLSPAHKGSLGQTSGEMPSN